eukprot:TRINITY_DN10356_c0_g1_i1.p1 TRINITY_DN10356_c0_g1~~TRINITY_DN10356_c0_g1_i1.p1  ORF type:complete len:221 (-),score=41.91 TRINITY_DN10356_c0_g1_i1:54-716(-)
MPRSKRNKVVALTKTKKKGKTGKSELIEEIGQAVTKYSSIYVLQPHNMRNSRLQELKIQFRSSRFFFGKNKVIIRALTSENLEDRLPNIEKLTEQIVGQCGVLFTNEPKDKIVSFFRSFAVQDYPRTGLVATRDVKLDAGIMEHFPASMETRFRSLGLPTKLTDGQIELLGDYTVCREGEVLSPEQAKTLSLLEDKMATFRVQLKCVWTPKKFEAFETEE